MKKFTRERVVPKVERREAASSPATHDIAIVGSAGRFPGAPNNDAFWQLLISGRSATRPLPPMRWDEYLGDPVVRTKMADLTRIEAVLSRLVNECHAQRGTVSCPLIDSLHGS